MTKARFFIGAFYCFYLLSFFDTKFCLCAANSEESSSHYTYNAIDSYQKVVEFKKDEEIALEQLREINNHLFLNDQNIGPKIYSIAVSFKIENSTFPLILDLPIKLIKDLGKIHPMNFDPVEFKRNIYAILVEDRKKSKDASFDLEQTQITSFMIEMEKFDGDLINILDPKGTNEYTPVTEDQFWPIMKSICEQVKTMHAKGIMHLDLKAENIFFKEDNFFIVGDFGFSRFTSHSIGFKGGSPNYITPEHARAVLFEEGKHQEPGFYKDYWAIGVTAYLLLTGDFLCSPYKEKPVYASKEEKEDDKMLHILTQIANFKKLSKKETKKWSKDQRIFVTNLLQLKKEKRRIVLPQT